MAEASDGGSDLPPNRDAGQDSSEQPDAGSVPQGQPEDLNLEAASGSKEGEITTEGDASDIEESMSEAAVEPS